MSEIAAVEKLQKIAAPELNFLLTEAPRLQDEDWGWYCREHAVGTVIIAALLGVTCQVVRGDFIVRLPGFRLSSIGAAYDHAWCCCAEAQILDLSLHFRAFGPWPQLAEPIVRLGRNGIFDVRILSPDTKAGDGFGDQVLIGYIPREVFREAAIDWIASPLPFLRNAESSAITMRVALHVFRVVTGQSTSLVGKMSQMHALVHLRLTYEDAVPDLQRLFENVC